MSDNIPDSKYHTDISADNAEKTTQNSKVSSCVAEKLGGYNEAITAANRLKEDEADIAAFDAAMADTGPTIPDDVVGELLAWKGLCEKMAEALRCWKLFMPIGEGDTLYSGHPKVMGEEALREYEGWK